MTVLAALALAALINAAGASASSGGIDTTGAAAAQGPGAAASSNVNPGKVRAPLGSGLAREQALSPFVIENVRGLLFESQVGYFRSILARLRRPTAEDPSVKSGEDLNAPPPGAGALEGAYERLSQPPRDTALAMSQENVELTRR